MKAVITAVVITMLLAMGVGFSLEHHKKQKALLEQSKQDFALTSKDKETIKNPIALVSKANTFELLDGKAQLIMYCNAVGCLFGKNVSRQSLATTMTELFLGLASANRIQQQKAYDAQQKIKAGLSNGGNPPAPAKPVSKAPDTRKPKGQSKLTGCVECGPVIQHSSGANSPNISGAANVVISNR